MAGKTKKQAAEAIDSLRNYLRRDIGGMRLLDQLSRYIGELRQDRTRNKSRIDQLEESCRQLECRARKSELEVVSLKAEIDSEKSRRAQAVSAAAIAADELSDLEGKLAPPEMSTDMTIGERKFWHLVKALKRRMPLAPAPIKRIRIGSADGYLFDLQDFVTDANDGELLTLGMYAIVSHVFMHELVAFTSDQTSGVNVLKNMSKSFRDEKSVSLMAWVKNWIAPQKSYEVKSRTFSESEIRSIQEKKLRQLPRESRRFC